MAETRLIIGHDRHQGQGPHLDLPGDFVPLRLCLDGNRLNLDVTCPVAIVGRHTDADLRFAYPDISRRHCRFAFENGQWRVYDLKSLNGIYVNNVPTLEATLYAGDILRIGCVKLLVIAGTPVRMARAEDEKLRQIVEVLPDV